MDYVSEIYPKSQISSQEIAFARTPLSNLISNYVYFIDTKLKDYHFLKILMPIFWQWIKLIVKWPNDANKCKKETDRDLGTNTVDNDLL